jgi:hypothetical protein
LVLLVAPMSALRYVGLVLIAASLLSTAGTSTVVIAAEQTVLDPDYVTDRLDREGAYDPLGEAVAADIVPSGTAAEGLPVGRSEVADTAISDSYVESQANTNIRRFYEYLHGERAKLLLEVETRPLKQNITARVETRVGSQEPHELLATGAAAQSEGALDTVEPALIEQLDAGPDSYDSAQRQFRTDIRDRIVARLVEEAFNSSSNDRLLALVIDSYNPRAYTAAEKQREVEQRAVEIRRALERQLREDRGAEIDEELERQLAELSQQVTTQDPSQVDVPAPLAEPAVDLQSAVVRGVTGEYAYEEYREEALMARDELAAGGGELARGQLESVPDQIVLGDRLDLQQRQTLQTAAKGVGWLDRLAIVLPLVSLLLMGLLYRLSASEQSAAAMTGGTLAIAGGAIVAGAQILSGRIAGQLPAGELSVIALALLEGFLSTLRTGGVALVLTGVTLLILALALRYELPAPYGP